MCCLCNGAMLWCFVAMHFFWVFPECIYCTTFFVRGVFYSLTKLSKGSNKALVPHTDWPTTGPSRLPLEFGPKLM
jgi:hypothetical protein